MLAAGDGADGRGDRHRARRHALGLTRVAERRPISSTARRARGAGAGRPGDLVRRRRASPRRSPPAVAKRAAPLRSRSNRTGWCRARSRRSPPPRPVATARTRIRATSRCSNASRSGARSPAVSFAAGSRSASSAPGCERGSPRSPASDLPSAPSSRSRPVRRVNGRAARAWIVCGADSSDLRVPPCSRLAGSCRSGPRSRRAARVQAERAGHAPIVRWRFSATGPSARLSAGSRTSWVSSLRLPGFVPRTDVARWLRASHVYVQPSISLPNGRSEGAPFATAEARAVGHPRAGRMRCRPAGRSALLAATSRRRHRRVTDTHIGVEPRSALRGRGRGLAA